MRTNRLYVLLSLVSMMVAPVKGEDPVVVETGKAPPAGSKENLDEKITGRVTQVDQQSKKVRIIEDNGQTTYMLIRKNCIFTRDSQAVAFSDIKKGDQVILTIAEEPE